MIVLGLTTWGSQCHTNAPYSWRLEGSLGDGPWQLLHWAGEQQECDVEPQRWGFDLERFRNDEVPGETRVFDVKAAGEVQLDRLRWVFYGEDPAKGFSVNLSGLLVYGNWSHNEEDRVREDVNNLACVSMSKS